MKNLLSYYWPVHEFRTTVGLPSHQVDAARMKNRWQLERLRPYLWRWLTLVGGCGLAADLGTKLPHGPLGYLVFLVGWAGFLGAGFMLVFWCWIFSLRPR